MGRRGPAKKPTTLKVLQGCPGGESKLPKNEPQPAKTRQAKPPFKLSKDESKIWRALAQKLESVGLLTVIDLNALSRYCQLYVKYHKAKTFLDAKDSFYYPIFHEQTDEEKAAGAPKRVKYLAQFPEVSIMLQLSKELRNIEAQFGMTPASRAGISVGMTPPAASRGVETARDRLFRNAR